MASFCLMTSLKIQSHSEILGVKTSTYEFGEGRSIQPVTRWRKKHCPGTSFLAPCEEPAPLGSSWRDDDFKVLVEQFKGWRNLH